MSSLGIKKTTEMAQQRLIRGRAQNISDWNISTWICMRCFAGMAIRAYKHVKRQPLSGILTSKSWLVLLHGGWQCILRTDARVCLSKLYILGSVGFSIDNESGHASTLIHCVSVRRWDASYLILDRIGRTL